MKKQTKQQMDFIRMVATTLAKIYMEPLIAMSKEKKYEAHVGGLAEILDWSQEFCDRYYDKILNWDMFKYSRDNTFKADSMDSLVISFGQERLNRFKAQNFNRPTYFLEKYAGLNIDLN